MPKTVSQLKPRVPYGVILEETVDEICSRRLLYSDLLCRSTDLRTAHAAFIVKETVTAIRDELLALIG